MYRYSAQVGGDGKPFAGTIEAQDAEEARQRLDRLGLWVLEMSPAPEAAPGDSPGRARPLRGEDFEAFNQQLAGLTAAGLPVVEGMRLIGREMRRGRMRTAIERVTRELESGADLPKAFERHKNYFPPLYSQLMEAGIAARRLPDVLFGLGRHLQMVARMRTALWQAAAYPLIVMIFFVIMMLVGHTFLSAEFRAIFDEFDTELPAITQTAMSPRLPIAWAITVSAVPIGLLLLSSFGLGRYVVRVVLLNMPLIGRGLRANLAARWCDALRLGVESGMDLPAAITMAGQTVGWRQVERESRTVARHLEEGGALDDATRRIRILPVGALAAASLATQGGNLAQSLEAMRIMYDEMSEIRMRLVLVFLGPAMLIMIGGMIAFYAAAMFLPLVRFIQAVG